MKQNAILSMLERRIRQGDYSNADLPPERTLAEEIGVSRVTVRRALRKLENKGLVTRLPNRRLAITPGAQSGAAVAQVAFLAPAVLDSASAEHQQWLSAVDLAAGQNSARVSARRYMHWDDPVLTSTLKDFPAVFLVPNSEPLPSQIERLIQEKDQVTVLSMDYTHLGKPSIRLFPPVFVQRILDHLYNLGHRRIDCLNVQGVDSVIRERIDEWMGWCRVHGVSGELITVPWSAHENIFQVAAVGAREKLRRLSPDTTALFCTTLPGAMGAIRAVHERDRKVGRDISICTVDGEGLAEWLIPSVTCLRRVDIVPRLAACLKWMLAGAHKEDWAGPLLLQPSEIPMYLGETTGPAPEGVANNAGARTTG